MRLSLPVQGPGKTERLVMAGALAGSAALVWIATQQWLAVLVFAAGIGALGALAWSLARTSAKPAEAEYALPDWSVTVAAIDRSDCAVAITDRAGRLVCANPRFETWFGIAHAPPRLPADNASLERLARAGRAAWRDGKGLADLIDAQTRAQARQALRQLEGGLGLMLRQWRSRLLSALARLEAEIDFGDEGAEVPAAELDEEIALLAAEMAKLLADRRGERLRDGLVVAVTGPPNVGKSSLVNALARREVALVSEHPGTTRDVIEVQLEIAGVPVTLLDTAGLRDATDPVEAMGVARARARMVSADLILRLFALGTDAPPDEPGARQVATKLDLAPHVPIPPPMIAVSAVTGEGLPEFLTAIAAEVTVLAGLAGEAMLTRARHREAVAAALRALQGFCRLQASEVALRAEELRVAAQAIARVTGAIGVEDILDEIFARFCLGK